jgi:hypothetical protein
MQGRRVCGQVTGVGKIKHEDPNGLSQGAKLASTLTTLDSTKARATLHNMSKLRAKDGAVHVDAISSTIGQRRGFTTVPVG